MGLLVSRRALLFLSCMVYSSIEVVVSFQVLIYGIWYSLHSFIVGVPQSVFII